MNQDERDELDHLVEELEKKFWVPILRTPFRELEEMQLKAKADCPELHACFSAFCSNLTAAKKIVELPYFLIAPLLPDLYAQAPGHLRGPEKIIDAETERQQTRQFVTAILRNAQRHLRDQAELQLLMHQACLLIWAALDTYSKEVFTLTLNQKPSLLTALYKEQWLKERFQFSGSAWLALLEEHQFNLQGKLGTIVSASKDFSSIPLMCDLFPVMYAGMQGPGFPEHDQLRKMLRILGQRRNLIAHRCGIVDSEYLKHTQDDSQLLGSQLKLRGKDIVAAFQTAARYAVLVYGTARYCWERPPKVNTEINEN